jgi:hypothetical protein
MIQLGVEQVITQVTTSRGAWKLFLLSLSVVVRIAAKRAALGGGDLANQSMMLQQLRWREKATALVPLHRFPTQTWPYCYLRSFICRGGVLSPKK